MDPVESLSELGQFSSLFDELAGKLQGRTRFSEIFQILFSTFDSPSAITKLSNRRAWLEIIADNFPEHFPQNDPLLVSIQSAFKDNSIFGDLDFSGNERSLRLIQFFAYLVSVYQQYLKIHPILLHLKGKERKDNVFGFMTDFEPAKAKVVIVGHYPSPEVGSSGQAFNLSPCPSTKQIIKFLYKEDDLIGDAFNVSEEVRHKWQMARKEYNDAQRSCDLTGWINQNVLMINSSLMYLPTDNEIGRKIPRANKDEQKTGRDKLERDWQVFSDFIVSWLSENGNNSRLFILAGNSAQEKATLINEERHAVIKVFHPSFYFYPKIEFFVGCQLWETNLPFLNANFLLFQTKQSLINWNDMRGSGVCEDYNTEIKLFFDKITTHNWNENPKLVSVDGHITIHNASVSYGEGKLKLLKFNFHEDFRVPKNIVLRRLEI